MTRRTESDGRSAERGASQPTPNLVLLLLPHHAPSYQTHCCVLSACTKLTDLAQARRIALNVLLSVPRADLCLLPQSLDRVRVARQAPQVHGVQERLLLLFRRPELDWKRHKPACLSRRHYIAHIDFDRSTTDYSPWFKPVLDAIKSRTYALVANPTELRSLLVHPILPRAILCTSAELAEKKHAYVRASLRTYVEQGGRVVVGGPGINHLEMDEIPRLLSSLGGVSWQVEGYHRTTHFLNSAHPLYAAEGDSAARAALPASYSCKAIVLKNVDPGEMVYRSTGDSGVESLAMAMHGGKVASDEVAVATAKVGEGWLSWVGDVNQEAGSTAAMLFLLGVKR